MFLAILLCIKWSRACLLTKDIFSWQSFPPLNPKCSRNYVWVHFYYCARHKFNLHFRECPRFFMFPLSLTKIGDKFHILQCWYLFWIRDIWEVLKILGRQICFLGFYGRIGKIRIVDCRHQSPTENIGNFKFLEKPLKT